MDGASRRGRMCWIASVCCCTAENCWAKPSTVSPNSPPWEMGASRKRALSTSFISARLSQRWRSWTTMVDIAFPRDRAVTFVARRASQSPCAAPASPRVGTTLVHLFERLGLVNLQDSHGVQARLPGPQHCKLWPRERLSAYRPWTGDADGSSKWRRFVGTSAPRPLSLHLGNARVRPGHSAIEGSEDGGGGRAASGRERGHPRTRQLLMHLREERQPGQGAVVSRAPLRETNRPAARARDWAVC